MFTPLTFAWNAFQFLIDYWWIYFPIVLFLVFRSLWTFYIESCFGDQPNNRGLLLEIRIPREIRKSPKAMEQFFCNIHNTRSGKGLLDRWWTGKKVLSFSLEAASIGGEVRFYIRTPKKFKNVVEANLYAQYQDLEIVEVAEDYVDELPDTVNGLYKIGYKIWGTEMMLGKPDVYPIRTYVQFEAMEEEKSLDPVSALLEVLSKIGTEERIWVQVIITPADSGWKDEAKKAIEKIRKEAEVVTGMDSQDTVMKNIQLTPGQRDVMQAIEENVAKLGFYTTIRIVYLAPKDVFDDGLASKGVTGAFSQYGSQNLNYFKKNGDKNTDEFLYLFRGKRLESRKRKMLSDYRERNTKESSVMGRLATSELFHFAFTNNPPVLNVEELATIYHFPTNLVLTSTMVRRIESKRIGPPAGLPIFGE